MALAVLMLDLAIYFQHRVFHAVPALWRLHRMHHADLDFDATTGLRFHPVEIGLSMAIKLAVVVLIGAPPVAVLVFEVILSAASIFNHSNVRLPERLYRMLRRVLVTPDMHRVHHSIIRYETNSNFGFSVPWWDRLFGTYLAQPRDGHDGMAIADIADIGMIFVRCRGGLSHHPAEHTELADAEIGAQILLRTIETFAVR